MQVKASLAVPMVAKFLKARLVPLLCGSPGIGKSSIAKQIADEFNLKLIDIRLAQCDPTDLAGFPMIQGNKAGYVPMDTFPIEGDSIPEGYSGWLILFDELTSASPAIQASSYKILLDRMVGNHHLHKNVAMMAAGNLESDNAIVQPMSTALQSRLVHMELVVDSKEWIEWATSNGIDHRITSYIKFKPGNLYTFVPDHTDHTYGCPRTWEFSSRILKDTEIGSPELLPMLAGTISEGVAREFIGFCKVYQDLPTVESIVNAPKTIKVPEESSTLYALTGSIAHNAKSTNVDALMEYVVRMPVEFQVICIKEMVRRTKPLMANKSVQSWIANTADVFF